MTNPESSPVALIMGAPASMAEALAVSLADSGYDVAVTTATTDAEEAYELRRVTRAVTKLGRRTMSEVIEMSIGAGVQVAVRQIAKEMGRIDLLVVAPELRIQRPAERLGDAEWTRLINLNLSAYFFACRSAFREMQTNDPAGGLIVLLVPAADAQSTPQEAGLIAAAGGVQALAGALAEEWSDRGVSVNVVALPVKDQQVRDELAVSLVQWLAQEAGESLSGQVIYASASESDDDEEDEATD